MASRRRHCLTRCSLAMCPVTSPLSHHSQVSFQYDSTTLPVGSSLSGHSKGQHDELCTGVSGKEFSDEPCLLLDAADSWLYLIFPESGLCCRACNTSSYCGIIAPWWLQENATYQGTAVIGGVACDGWMKQGGEQNFYYTTVASRDQPTARQPCQYFGTLACTRERRPCAGASCRCHHHRASNLSPRDDMTAGCQKATPLLRKDPTTGISATARTAHNPSQPMCLPCRWGWVAINHAHKATRATRHAFMRGLQPESARRYAAGRRG